MVNHNRPWSTTSVAILAQVTILALVLHPQNLVCVCVHAYSWSLDCSHHVRAMAPPAGHTTPAWECRGCYGADGKRYRNNGSRKSCHKCSVAKGSCFHDNVKPSTPSRRSGGANAKPNSDDAKRIKDLEAAFKKQTAELDKLKNAAGAPDNVSADGGADDQNIAWDKRIKYLRDSVALLKNAPSEEARPGALVEAEEKLATLLRAKEEAKPPNARLSSARDRLSQKEKALDKANAAKSAAEKILAEAQEELAKTVEAHTEAVDGVAAAKADLATATELVSGKAPPPEVQSVDELQALLITLGNTMGAAAHPDDIAEAGRMFAHLQTMLDKTKARDARPEATAGGNPEQLLAEPPAQRPHGDARERPENQLAESSLDAGMGLDFSEFDGLDDEEDDEKKYVEKVRSAVANLKGQQKGTRT